MKNEDVKIVGMPDNDYIYLVIKYGCIVKMNNRATIPKIQVVLRKIDRMNYLPENKSKDIIVYLAMNELDAVRLGTFWKRQMRLEQKCTNFEHFEYAENLEFSFNFNIYSPTVINYNQYLIELNNSLENIYKLNLPCVYKSDLNRINLLKETKYVKLTNSQGIIVLIPCLELFASAFTPENKMIKESLLQYDLDTSISKYLNIDKCYIYDNTYYIDLKTNDLGLRNKEFLAYMKFNDISRERVKKLWNSLELDQNKFDGKYPVRFPVVLPYHPTYLEISACGLWLNEKVFFILRIYNRNIPKDNQVRTTYKNQEIEIQEEGVKYYNSNPKDEPELEGLNENNQDEDNQLNIILETENVELKLDSGEEPSKRNYRQRIVSEVGILGDDAQIEHHIINEHHTIIREELIENKEKGDKTGKGENLLSGEINNASIDLSSAENSSTQENEILHLHVEAKFNSEETKHLFESVISALNDIKKDEKKFEFEFLDSTFVSKKSFLKTTFFDTIINTSRVPKVDSWYKLKQRKDNRLVELGYREYLLIKINWNKMSCFLLEIGKKEGEGYSGLVFYIEDIDNVSITLSTLLKEIVNQKGAYSKKDSIKKVLTPISLPVKYETYKHLINKSNEYVNLKKKIKEKIEDLYKKIS